MLINYLCEPGPWTPPVARYCRSGSERTLRCLLTWPCWAVTSHNIDQSDQSSRSLRPGTQCNQNYSWKHQANRYILKIPANESVTMKYLTIILFKLVEKNTTSNDDFVFLCFTTPLKKGRTRTFDEFRCWSFRQTPPARSLWQVPVWSTRSPRCEGRLQGSWATWCMPGERRESALYSRHTARELHGTSTGNRPLSLRRRTRTSHTVYYFRFPW